MVSNQTETGYRESLPGIRQKTRVFGKNTLMAGFRLNKGSPLPRHTHPHEHPGTQWFKKRTSDEHLLSAMNNGRTSPKWGIQV